MAPLLKESPTSPSETFKDRIPVVRQNPTIGLFNNLGWEHVRVPKPMNVTGAGVMGILPRNPGALRISSKAVNCDYTKRM